MAAERALATEIGSGEGLRRSLRRRHMQMIALGGVIGAGLFVGSGVVIRAAGPAAVITLASRSALAVRVISMLGEMAVVFPAAALYHDYNRLMPGARANC